MSYQEQLAYLRQKREQEKNSVVQAPSTVAAEQEKAYREEGWQEMDEQTIAALEERRQKDKWLFDAGQLDDMPAPGGQVSPADEARFKEEFDNNPLTKKYGAKVEAMAGELTRLVQDPNSPMDPQKAMALFEEVLNKMVNGDFDDE